MCAELLDAIRGHVNPLPSRLQKACGNPNPARVVPADCGGSSVGLWRSGRLVNESSMTAKCAADKGLRTRR
jgi:hypothetical protein